MGVRGPLRRAARPVPVARGTVGWGRGRLVAARGHVRRDRHGRRGLGPLRSDRLAPGRPDRRRLLGEFVLGEDPLATALLHDRMLRLHRHGRAGLFVNAISAVDNALWDLRGKAAGEPVYRLLGGPTRDRVPAYASMLGYSVDPERAAVAAREHAELGFAAQKWFFRYGPGAGRDGMLANLAMARAVREAVGPGYPLMFDAFMGWDPTYGRTCSEGSRTWSRTGSRSRCPPSGSRPSGGSPRPPDPAGHRRARAHALADQGAPRQRRDRRRPGRPGLGGRDHRAAPHLLALLRVRRPGRRARPRGAGRPSTWPRPSPPPNGPDARVPGPGPGAEPVLPADDPPARERVHRPAHRSRARHRPRRVEDRRQARARSGRLNTGPPGGETRWSGWRWVRGR